MALADLDTLEDRLVEATVAAWRGGLRWVVLRVARGSTRERVELGRALLDRCLGLFLTVHGDPRACRLLDAPGLHLPSRGFDVAALRRGFPGGLLGVSCHGAAEIAGAEAAGADYGFLSPLFRPTSKPAAAEPLGVEGFRSLASGAKIPLLALGGLRADRLGSAARAGAAGAAVLGHLFQSPDPEARALRLRAEADAAFAPSRAMGEPAPIEGGTHP